MQEIADTGIIVAFLNRNDRYHSWALDAFRAHAPFHTCEAVWAESGSFFPNPKALLSLVSSGDLVVDSDFVLAHETPRLLALDTKYCDCPMDLADACIVRMAEITQRCRVWTVDRSDFATYRRNERHAIPCEFPNVL